MRCNLRVDLPEVKRLCLFCIAFIPIFTLGLLANDVVVVVLTAENGDVLGRYVEVLLSELKQLSAVLSCMLQRFQLMF
jgi:hypothetical protein